MQALCFNFMCKILLESHNDPPCCITIGCSDHGCLSRIGNGTPFRQEKSYQHLELLPFFLSRYRSSINFNSQKSSRQVSWPYQISRFWGDTAIRDHVGDPGTWWIEMHLKTGPLPENVGSSSTRRGNSGAQST